MKITMQVQDFHFVHKYALKMLTKKPTSFDFKPQKILSINQKERINKIYKQNKQMFFLKCTQIQKKHLKINMYTQANKHTKKKHSYK